ncbi:MAG: signal peptide peptidase SppA [Planctomycetes bacterium]|nr:signal peptide peptidase SppA [Planctomycetota bacterium]
MKRFFTSVIATMVGGVLLLFFGSAMLASIVEVVADEQNSNQLPPEYVLVLDGSVVTSETGSVPDPIAAMQGNYENSVALRRLLEAIEYAAEDSEVLAILLDGSMQISGRAQRHQVHNALQLFKESGKKIYAFSDGYDMNSYHLASLADEIFMPPMADFYMMGLSAELSFYSEALENIGVEFQVTKVGKYKSAVEPFILREASAENRQQIELLLEDVQNDVLQDIASGQRATVKELQTIIDNVAVFTADEAIAAGLIDQAMYRDQLIDHMIKLFGQNKEQDSFIQAGSNSYLNAFDFSDDNDCNIAVVYADGDIVDGYSSDSIGGDSLSQELRAVRSEDDIEAVVLRVNSPGGSAYASEQILREVQLLRESGKKVVVSMAAVAASGGYWISASADAIVAQANTITGSIGVFGMFPNYQKLREKIGINVQSVKTGKFADVFTLARSKSADELALAQKSVDKIYEDFLDRVSAGRSLERDAVYEIAQGRVWTGSRALELGLVDKLGGLDVAIELAAELAELDDFSVSYREPILDEFDMMLAELLASDDEPIVKVPAIIAELNSLIPASMIKPGIKARLPFNLKM